MCIMLSFVPLDEITTLVREMKMETSADTQSKVSWILTFKPVYLASTSISHAGANAEADSVTEKKQII